MDKNRVVHVTFADYAKETNSYEEGSSASGYLLTDQVVLTTGHLSYRVPGRTGSHRHVQKNDIIKVTPYFGGGSYFATVIWRGSSPEGFDDIALARIGDPAWGKLCDEADGAKRKSPRERATEDSEPPRLGQLVTDSVDAESIGYPKWNWTGRARPAAWNPQGLLNRINNAHYGEYILTTHGHPPVHNGPSDSSPWEGMSGASVFARESDLLLGVIKSDIGGSRANLAVIPVGVIKKALMECELDPMLHLLHPVEFDRITNRPPVEEPQILADLKNAHKMINKVANWCEGAGFASWALISRNAGRRIQIAHQASALLGKNWVTLWLAERDTTAADFQIMANVSRPLLVIVDNAERRATQVTQFLHAVARRRSKTPIRLLLLSATSSDWLKNPKSGDREIENLIDKIRPKELESWNRNITARRTVAVFALAVSIAATGSGIGARFLDERDIYVQKDGKGSASTVPPPVSFPPSSGPSEPSQSPSQDGPKRSDVPSSPSPTSPSLSPKAASPNSIEVTNPGDHRNLGFDVDTEKLSSGTISSWQEFRVRFDRIYPEQPEQMGTLTEASLDDCSNLSGFAPLGDYYTGSPLGEGAYCTWSNGETAKTKTEKTGPGPRLACLVVISDLRWHEVTIAATPSQEPTAQKEYTSFSISKECRERTTASPAT